MKVVNHKSWPYLAKLDDIFMDSTTTGQFAHDGGNHDNKSDSNGSDSDDSVSAAANQVTSNPLFPPSAIAPFSVLSQMGSTIPSVPSLAAATALPSSSIASVGTLLLLEADGASMLDAGHPLSLLSPPSLQPQSFLPSSLSIAR